MPPVNHAESAALRDSGLRHFGLPNGVLSGPFQNMYDRLLNIDYMQHVLCGKHYDGCRLCLIARSKPRLETSSPDIRSMWKKRTAGCHVFMFNAPVRFRKRQGGERRCWVDLAANDNLDPRQFCRGAVFAHDRDAGTMSRAEFRISMRPWNYNTYISTLRGRWLVFAHAHRSWCGAAQNKCVLLGLQAYPPSLDDPEPSEQRSSQVRGQEGKDLDSRRA